MVEQNNKLIMKNHELRPYGFQPFIEVNANTSTNSGRNWEGKRGRGYYPCGGHMHSGQQNNENGCH